MATDSNQNQNTPFSQEELQDFQEKLEGLLKSSMKQAELVQNRLQGLDTDEERNQSYGDDSKAEQDRAKLGYLLEQETKRIRQIEAALAKIENRTYGICEVTGEPIKKDRLEQIPFTPVSIEGARILESR